jgi:serine/threonine-protein phosphatase 6 catalytic subunit
MSGKLDLDYWL